MFTLTVLCVVITLWYVGKIKREVHRNAATSKARSASTISVEDMRKALGREAAEMEHHLLQTHREIFKSIKDKSVKKLNALASITSRIVSIQQNPLKGVAVLRLETGVGILVESVDGTNELVDALRHGPLLLNETGQDRNNMILKFYAPALAKPILLKARRIEILEIGA